MDYFSLKELYDVVIKSTYPIEIGKKTFEIGEILLAFDQVTIANLDEIKSFVFSRGGFDNRALVSWENTKEININFIKGVFSLNHLALLSNSKLLEIENSSISITKREIKESSEEGIFELDEIPSSKVFLYDKSTGEGITSFTRDGKIITLTTTEKSFVEVYVCYEFEYTDKSKTIVIGNRLINGYLSLEAKTRLKDDTTGQVVTGIFKIPKLKLMSDLSMRLGEKASPIVADFRAIGIPVGSRGANYVCEFVTLEKDIDSDL
jgi:hypothetical protein